MTAPPTAPDSSRQPTTSSSRQPPTSRSPTPRFTPFHVAAAGFLVVGLVLGAYRGLAQFDVVALPGWLTWSHIHYVTIGGFTQLLFGMLPQLAARKLGRPGPGTRSQGATFVALNGGLLLAWYGRATGYTLAFDLGLGAVWLATLATFGVVLAMALRAEDDRAWNPTIGLFLLSLFTFLIGILYAIGLYSHPWVVPGGWHGLREAHVHANAWGFLGLAVIGTLHELVPRLARTDLHSDRLAVVTFWLVGIGIFPLITGPWLGMGRLVTMPGLVLYGAGFILALYNLVRTYRSGKASPIVRSLLVSQGWILGPAAFAPFLLFGLPLGIQSAWVEQGALHFFFLGWALPVALAGLRLSFLNLPCMVEGRLGLADQMDDADRFPANTIPDSPAAWTLVAWHLAVVLVGLGFFFQDQAVARILFAVGWPVILVLWAARLAGVVAGRLRLRRTRGAAD